MLISRFVRYFISLSVFLFLLDLPAVGKTQQFTTLPLTFEQNIGQAPASSFFVMHRNGVRTLFGREGVSIRQRGPATGELRLNWIGANVQPTGTDAQPGHANYLIGNDPSKWIRNVPEFQSIVYHHLYPGISLLFYGNADALEHDFKLDPGADPSRIALKFDGAQNVGLDQNGNLQVSTASGVLVLKRPIAYQEGSRRKQIDASFTLAKDGTVGFHLGAYDNSLPLVIDPVFTFSSYLAGTGTDLIDAITTDAAGNIYSFGTTSSADFPTVAPLQSKQNCGEIGCTDAFVTKVDPTGHTLLYSTYVGTGGIGYSNGGAIAVDANGNIVISGVTDAANFPQAGNLPSISLCPGGNSCYFLASIKPDGSAFNYSGMLEAIKAEYANPNGPVVIDAAGNAYLAGLTNLSTFPITPGTLAPSLQGYPYSNTFVLKVDPTGKLLYATIIPGNAPQLQGSVYANVFLPYGMTVDTKGQITLAGTGGLGLLTTAGVIDPTLPSSATSPDPAAGFVLQLNATASAINFASYLPSADEATALAVDASGNYFITGNTSQTTLPVSSNAYQKTCPQSGEGSADCGYVMEISPGATAVVAASYLGGGSSASPQAVLLDSQRNIYVGAMAVAGLPLVNPIVPFYEPGESNVDLALAELSPDMSSLLFGSYLNSTTDVFYNGSVFAGMAVDSSNKLIVAGVTSAQFFPTTENAFEPNLPAPANPLSSSQHSFLSKIDLSVPAPSVCLDTMNVSFGNVPAKTSSSQIVHATNCGNAPLTVASVLSTDPSVIEKDTCTEVAPGAVCTLTLTFTPANTNGVYGNLSIADNAVVSPQLVAFSGQGVGVQLTTNPASLTFGHLLVGTTSSLSVSLGNTGSAPLSVSSITVTGASFSILSNSCPTTFTIQYQCAVGVSFSPASGGAQSGSLIISSNDPVNPTTTIPLSGSGDIAYASPTVASIGAGTVQINNGPATINILGSNFYPATTVQLNGVTLQSKFISNNQMSATIAASSLTTLGEQSLIVSNPGTTAAPAVVVTPYAALPATVSALVSVPATKLLYAAVPSGSATNPNTVLPINPATLTIGTPIPVGNDPAFMAASSDGSYLFVANQTDLTVDRINLQTNTVDRTFPFSPNPFCPGCSTLPATDLEAVPGMPQEVVLAQGGMISLYNDAGLVSYTPTGFVETSAPTFNKFTYAGSPLTIYALPFTTIKNPFFTIATLSDSAVTWVPPTENVNYGPTVNSGNQVLSDGTLLYTSGGQIWNPASQAQVGSFAVASYQANSSIALNTSTKQYFAMGYQNYDTEDTNADAPILTAYSTSSQQLSGTLAFPDIDDPVISGLSLWGADGFAFTGDSGNVYLLRSSLMGLEAKNPAPAITSMTPTPITAGLAAGNIPNVTVIGTGFVPDSTVIWNGKNEPTQFVSSTKLEPILNASDIAQAGNISVQVVNPAPGGGTSNTYTYAVGPAAPSANFLQTALDFGSIVQGQTSPSQEVFLTNQGSGGLKIASVTTSGDFAVTSTCGTNLGIDGDCRIFASFTPTAAGARTGTLTVMDNAGNSPQTMNLTGIGVSPFLISVPAGGVTTATVAAGGTASYNLSLNGAAQFSGMVSLSCSGAPAKATCTVTPASLQLTDGSSSAFKVSVTTTASSSNSAVRASHGWLDTSALVALVVLPFASFSRRRMGRSLCGLLFCLAIATMGCGGGGSSSSGSSPTPPGTPPPVTPPPVTPPSSGSPGTPAGTYTLTLTASSGSISNTQSLTLVVQ